MFKTHVVCVTDKNAGISCGLRVLIFCRHQKEEERKTTTTYYIEKEGRNLEHNEECVRNSANCPGNTTVRSNLMQHVQALHPISLVTTGKAVSKTLAEKEQMTVRPKQAKEVLNKRNGNTKEAYRNSMKAVDYYKNFFNKAGSGAKMGVKWRDGAPAHGLPQNGNKYFDGYQICATGLRNFVAKVGIPFFSFDACFSKHTYYKGVYGNLVALVDTKAGKLTNVPFALTTDESEQESLYSGLLNASECNNADSELAKRMKESVSCVIGDGSPQFLNAARTTLGYQKPIATCSLHVKENTARDVRPVGTRHSSGGYSKPVHVWRETLPGRLLSALFPGRRSLISALNSMTICPIVVALGRDSLICKKEYAHSVERVRITRSSKYIRSKYPKDTTSR